MHNTKKEQSRKTTHTFTHEDLIFAAKRLEFKAYYQPKIDLKNLSLVGLEILLRWHHPSLGILTPDVFLSEIIEAGCLNSITHSLLDQAIVTQHMLIGAGINSSMALNLEPCQISDSEFIHKLITKLTHCSAIRGPLTIEITENGTEPLTSSYAIKNIEKLRTAGCCISIDDFGTGHSSLERICQIPCSELKIDRLFTRHMLSDLRYKKIIQHILKLSKAFKLNVVAEGIETFQQLKFLQSIDCNQGQGYLFSPAISAEKILQWCIKWNIPKQIKLPLGQSSLSYALISLQHPAKKQII